MCLHWKCIVSCVLCCVFPLVFGLPVALGAPRSLRAAWFGSFFAAGFVLLGGARPLELPFGGALGGRLFWVFAPQCFSAGCFVLCVRAVATLFVSTLEFILLTLDDFFPPQARACYSQP